MSILLSWSLDSDDWTNDSLVEGVGNDVLFSSVFFLACVTFLIYSYIFREEHGYEVHPEHQEHLNNFRQNVTQLTQEEIQSRVEQAAAREDKTCAICISNCNFTVLCNCGHMFCCECIVGYWNHRGNLFTPITCAICRTPVTLLLPVQWPTRTTAENPEQYTTNVGKLDDYNRRFGGERPWREYISDIPVLIPFLFRNLLGMNGLMVLFRLRVILIFMAVIVYTLMPLDIFPEGAYGIVGFLDDVFVAILMFVYLAIALRYFLSRRGEELAARNAQAEYNVQNQEGHVEARLTGPPESIKNR